MCKGGGGIKCQANSSSHFALPFAFQCSSASTSVRDRWLPHCRLLGVTGGHSGSQSPFTTIIQKCLQGRESSEHLPSGMLSPKATVQSNPLLTGALTSAESLDRTIPLLLERRQKRHNYLQSSHQAQQGLRDGCWGPHIHSTSTSQTAQPWPVTIFSPRGKTTVFPYSST